MDCVSRSTIRGLCSGIYFPEMEIYVAKAETCRVQGQSVIFQADRSNNSTSSALQPTLVSCWEQQELISLSLCSWPWSSNTGITGRTVPQNCNMSFKWSQIFVFNLQEIMSETSPSEFSTQGVLLQEFPLSKSSLASFGSL